MMMNRKKLTETSKDGRRGKSYLRSYHPKKLRNKNSIISFVIISSLTIGLIVFYAGYRSHERGPAMTTKKNMTQLPARYEEDHDEHEKENSLDDDDDDYDDKDDDPIKTKNIETRKPLEDLLNGTKIRGEVSSLLDFVIADFPKCGTTFLMMYIRKSRQVFMNRGEVCSMDRNRPHRVVELYHNAPNYTTFSDDDKRKYPMRIGMKCPQELETEHALPNYARYFPRTNFIIGTRHPIKWFQSFYNYRAYHGHPIQMPHPRHLIGACAKTKLGVPTGYPYVPADCNRHCESGNQNVCTDRGNFHVYLSRLGKTSMDTEEERSLLMKRKPEGMKGIEEGGEGWKGKVFLMEMEQAKVENKGSVYLARDLSKFLGLEEELPPLKPFHGRPEIYNNQEAVKHMIDICEDQFQDIRDLLVAQGKEAADWIRDYFLKSPDVFVSSKDEFVKLVERWGHDPCLELKKDGRRLMDDGDYYF